MSYWTSKLDFSESGEKQPHILIQFVWYHFLVLTPLQSVGSPQTSPLVPRSPPNMHFISNHFYLFLGYSLSPVSNLGKPSVGIPRGFLLSTTMGFTVNLPANAAKESWFPCLCLTSHAISFTATYLEEFTCNEPSALRDKDTAVSLTSLHWSNEVIKVLHSYLYSVLSPSNSPSASPSFLHATRFP